MLSKNNSQLRACSQHEKRRHARLQKNIAIKFKDANVDFVTETINISCIGAYCQINGYVPILTKLMITLLLPRSSKIKSAKHITCEGTVVRIERVNDTLEPNKYNIAIYFNKIPKNDMKFIDNYVKNNLSSSAL